MADDVGQMDEVIDHICALETRAEPGSAAIVDEIRRVSTSVTHMYVSAARSTCVPVLNYRIYAASRTIMSSASAGAAACGRSSGTMSAASSSRRYTVVWVRTSSSTDMERRLLTLRPDVMFPETENWLTSGDE